MAIEEVRWDPWKQGQINLLYSERWTSTIIIQDLRIFSQNVWKNSFIINTILKTQIQFDIIFIQELPWSEIHIILSSLNCEGEALIGTTHHPNWLLFAKTPSDRSDSSKVIIYINIHLSSFCFSLCNDIINYRDILLISFLNNHICYFIMNIYSDSSYMALNYLKNTVMIDASWM